MTGIYKISNHLNECYIGSSHNIEKRFMEHKNSHNLKLRESINTHGIENHTFEVLEECKEDVFTERERFFIEKYKETNTIFNCRIGGGGGRRSIKDRSELRKPLHVFIKEKIIDIIGRKECELLAINIIEKEYRKRLKNKER